MNRPITLGVTLLALAAGGAGAAYAVAGDDEREGAERSEQADGGNLRGATYERAERAALSAARGGSVVEAEKGDDGDGAYEVAVRKADGSVVEYHLDRGFKVVGTEKE